MQSGNDGLKWGRRAFLLASGAMATTFTPSLANAQSSPLTDVMQRWNSAPILPLWPSTPPGTGFRAQPLPLDWPINFLRNIDAPYLRTFTPKQPNGRSLLIMPGGAYIFVSVANEGVEIAEYMAEQGYTVFVLVYRLPGEGWSSREDVPLQDAQRAMRVIRGYADQHQLNPDEVYTLGFSAGGHLAASLATGFNEHVYTPMDGADEQDARPAAVGLIYPVISLAPGIGHTESTMQLLGGDATQAVVTRRSPALHVGLETPPGFLLHTVDDPAVPIENSLIMMRAFRDAQRPIEAHFFPDGGHGFGRGIDTLTSGHWLPLFVRWLDAQATARAAGRPE